MRKSNLYYSVLFLCIAFLLGACSRSREEMIVGTWQVNEPDNSFMQNREIIMRIKPGQEMEMQIGWPDRKPEIHKATYALVKDGKILQVMREGKKDRLNEAEIVELTETALVLIDISGGRRSDTLHWKRIKP